MKTTMPYSTLMIASDFEEQDLREKYLVLQVDEIHNQTYYEIIKKETYTKLVNLENEAKEEDFDAQFIQACETELNKDPFKNGFYNGKKLIDIKKNDPEWWENALHNFKNQYILKLMKIIDEGIKNGKVYN